MMYSKILYLKVPFIIRYYEKPTARYGKSRYIW